MKTLNFESISVTIENHPTIYGGDGDGDGGHTVVIDRPSKVVQILLRRG